MMASSAFWQKSDCLAGFHAKRAGVVGTLIILVAACIIFRTVIILGVRP